MSGPSWHARLLGGFRKTSDRLIGNLAGLGLARLDDATLDEIEEALIASDLGPATAARVRQRLADGGRIIHQPGGGQVIDAGQHQRRGAAIHRPLRRNVERIEPGTRHGRGGGQPGEAGADDDGIRPAHRATASRLSRPLGMMNAPA